MRIIVAVLVLSFSITTFAQECNTAFMESTFKIIGIKKGSNATGINSNQTTYTYGTVFFVGKPSKKQRGVAFNVLVTAAHILEEINGDIATLVLRKKNPDGTFGKTSMEIKIRENDKPLYITHPEADVAVMYLALPEGSLPGLLPITDFATDQTYDEFEIHPGDELLNLGYPLFVENEAGFAILRSGKIASYPLVPTKRVKRILYDSQVYNGNSGGPVYMAQRGRTYKGVWHYEKNICRLIGLLRGQVSSVPELGSHPLQLAEVVPAEFILETINRLPDVDTKP